MAYTIDWTSNNLQGILGKSPITLNDKSYDSTSTSLVLTGRGVLNYGEIQQENFLHLLENFASNSPPEHPTVGQMWFNPSQHSMFTYVELSTVPPEIIPYLVSGSYAWIKTGGAGSPAEIASTLGYVPVESVNGHSGQSITLTASDIGGLTTSSSPTFSSLNITNSVTTRGGRAAAVNPTTPLDGDIQVVGSVISIRAGGVWQQVFPAVYS